MSETTVTTTPRTPTVYFIDDSATMREVIKIAFRRENINIITCKDAASALAQLEQTAPDAVISDVIMPDKDGYEVCQFLKQHPQFGRTPVILMSGVVNRTVAEKAIAAKADELIRKPFEPQELLARVKKLLYPNAGPEPQATTHEATRSLTSMFASTRPTAPAATLAAPAALPAAPRTAAATAFASAAPPPPSRSEGPSFMEVPKLRSEIVRLQLLVKKLESELAAERQYCSALEAHFKAIQEDK